MAKDVSDRAQAELSWWKRQQREFRQEVDDFNLEDCRGCRFIGGGGMIAAGLYVAYVGYNRASKLGRKWGFIPSTVAGSALLVLGITRFAGQNPFSSDGHSVGIDALEPLKEKLSKTQTQAALWRKLQERKQTDTPEHMQEKQQEVEQIGQQERTDSSQQIKDLSTGKDKAALS